MIPSRIIEDISNYLGSTPKPYSIPHLNGNYVSTCEYWDLPPQSDEDKPFHIHYQEITQKILQLSQENKNDPQIRSLVEEANELLKGIPVTKKFGYEWISFRDALKRDKTMGVRKEWWELRSKYKDCDLCIFQGYKSTEARTTRIADILIVMPNPDQYEFLRVNQTRGNNHSVDTDRIIAALQKIDDEYGVVIIYASLDSVEFIFEKPVEPNDVNRIRQRLVRLCPSAEEITASIHSGRVDLWWD